jgi:hypothetical protein
MKKLALLTVVLLTFGLVSLGAQMMDETSGLSFNIDGKGSSTIGYDLQNGDFGFSNSASSSVDITLVSGSSENTGMSPWGKLELEDFLIMIDTDADADSDGAIGYTDDAAATGYLPLLVQAPDVTATIYIDPLYIEIYGADGMKSDMVGNVEGDEDGDYAAEDDEGGADLQTDLNHDGGLTFGYADGGIDIGIMVASADDHTDGTTSDLSLGAKGSIEAGPATISFDIVRNLGNQSGGDDTGIGAKVALDVESGDITIAPYAGIDVNLSGGTTLMEIGAGATVTVNSELELGLAFILGEAIADGGVGTDLEVTLDSGDLLPLVLTATLGLYDLDEGANSDVLVLLGAEYGMDLASGGTSTTALDVDVNIVNGGTAVTGIAVTETIGGIIENVEFELQWDTDDISNNNGELTFKTTVEY